MPTQLPPTTDIDWMVNSGLLNSVPCNHQPDVMTQPINFKTPDTIFPHLPTTFYDYQSASKGIDSTCK